MINLFLVGALKKEIIFQVFTIFENLTSSTSFFLTYQKFAGVIIPK